MKTAPSRNLARRCRRWAARRLAGTLGWQVCRKVAHAVLPAGISDRGERVAPENPTDCYVAHLSIYDFATRFTQGKAVLDAGCGAGYGSHHLLTKGVAGRVEGVDISPKAIRYCRRHYRDPRLLFRVGDLLDLASAAAKFDFVFASNVMEHVPHIEQVLHGLALTLTENGVMVIAVPPILSREQLLDNFRNPYHLNNFHPRQWLAKMQRLFESVAIFRHEARPGIHLDFASEAPSHCTPSDFVFTPVPPSRIEENLKASLTLLIVAERPRKSPLPSGAADVPLFDRGEIETMWKAAEPDRRRVFSANGSGSQYDDAALRKRIYPMRSLVA